MCRTCHDHATINHAGGDLSEAACDTKPKFDQEMSDSTRRKNWRRDWLDAIAYFEDIETQKQRWLDPKEENPHWTYVEVMCGYFDDASLDRGYEYWLERNYLSKEEHEAAADFHELVKGYEPPNRDEYDHAAILADPKWHELCEAAHHTAIKLHALVEDRTEKAAIEPIGPEKWE